MFVVLWNEWIRYTSYVHSLSAEITLFGFITNENAESPFPTFKIRHWGKRSLEISNEVVLLGINMEVV